MADGKREFLKEKITFITTFERIRIDKVHQKQNEKKQTNKQTCKMKEQRINVIFSSEVFHG